MGTVRQDLGTKTGSHRSTTCPSRHIALLQTNVRMYKLQIAQGMQTKQMQGQTNQESHKQGPGKKLIEMEGPRNWEAHIVVGRGSVPRQIVGTIADVQCSRGTGIQVDGTRVGYTEARLSGTVEHLQDLTGTQTAPPSQRRSEQPRWLGCLTTRAIERKTVFIGGFETQLAGTLLRIKICGTLSSRLVEACVQADTRGGGPEPTPTSFYGGDKMDV